VTDATDGFSVDVDCLRETAARMRLVVDEMRSGTCGVLPSTGDEYLDRTLQEFDTAWVAGQSRTADDVESTAGKLTACADDYEAAEQAALDQLSGIESDL
jgi:hypothetical protein